MQDIPWLCNSKFGRKLALSSSQHSVRRPTIFWLFAFGVYMSLFAVNI